MNKIKSMVNALITTFALSSFAQASDAFPVLKGPWLGQQEPGMTPELFAPDIVSVMGRYEFGVSFSPDLTEIYFTGLEIIEGVDTSPEIFYSKIKNGQWTVPQKAHFTEGRMDYELVPYASLNEDKIYFTGRKTDSKESGIWYVTRTEESWSKAKRMELPLNNGRLSDFNQGINGDLIFTNMKERKMYYAENNNGHFSEAKPMQIEFGIHGFIAPDQDYLLVNARHQEDKSRKDADLFVYFKQDDGSWSKPISLGDKINTPYSETVPRVSPDGKYLFFGRYNEPDQVSNIYWVSTEVITKLKNSYFSEQTTPKDAQKIAG